MNTTPFRSFILLAFVLFYSFSFSSAQEKLHPGFDAGEYLKLLEMTSRQADTTLYKPDLPFPSGYKLLYTSPETGLYNKWFFWLRNDGVGVISVRGTIMKTESWMENFYCAMIPAAGSIQLNDSTNFRYKLAGDTGACVHVGWTIGLASMAPDIIAKIKEYYAKGVKEYIIMGHSQGGAIAFLLRSYLYYLDPEVLPRDIVFKTYCSAAPKPGNLKYAYDFDFITRGGWAHRVVNTLDWVPESPFTIQTMQDMNKVNPFINVMPIIQDEKNFIVRMYLKKAYKKMDNSTKTARDRYERYLGGDVYKQVAKMLPQLKQPVYASTLCYMTAGSPIILRPMPGYDEKFKFDGKNIFINHLLDPYYDETMYWYVEKH